MLDASGQMGLDEAILARSPEASLVLRFFRWSGPAVTFGYSQPYVLAEGAAQARGLRGCPVVRRSTGGGVVFHDGDVTFSVCFSWPRLSAPGQIYEQIHRGVLAGLHRLGIEAGLWPGPAPARQAQCFTGPEVSDLVDGQGRKLLGGALRRRLGRGLYQGSLRLKGGIPRYLEPAVSRGLAERWGQQPLPGLEASWLDAGVALAEKYSSDAWNKRR